MTHPLIVKVHDLVVEGTTLAIVMDLVQGPSLNQLLGMHGPLAVADAVIIIRGVLSALGAAHAAGVVHRDVKADNVLLATAHGWQGKDVRLADFGIAAIVREDTDNRTEAIGTPNYMAPELIAYGKSGPASDIYSAGILFYALIAGRTPFAEPTPHRLLSGFFHLFLIGERMLNKQLTREQQIAALEKDWAENPRWKNVKRGLNVKYL